MDNNLIYLIIILCIITITIYFKKYYLNKEGIANPFSFIAKLFTSIGDLFTSIFTIFGLIGDIFSMIACPFSIWSNIGKCLSFWFLDNFCTLLYWIWFILMFIFIYSPIFIGWSVVCLTMGDVLNACKPIRIYDICPTRKSFFKYVDYMYYSIFDEYLLYRSKKDISKCYCVPPLKMALGPLEEKLKPQSLKEEETKDSSRNLLISIIIFTFIFSVYSAKKYISNVSIPKSIPGIPTGMPSIPGLPTGIPLKGLPIDLSKLSKG